MSNFTHKFLASEKCIIPLFNFVAHNITATFSFHSSLSSAAVITPVCPSRHMQRVREWNVSKLEVWTVDFDMWLFRSGKYNGQLNILITFNNSI